MKSFIRPSSVRAVASAVAISALTLSTAFAATYVPHENNFFPNDAITRGTVSTKAAPTDTRMPKSTDTMHTSSPHKALMNDKTQSAQRTEGAAR